MGPLIGHPFYAGRFAAAGVLAWLFGCAVAAVAALLSVVTLSRGVATGITVGGVVLMYLVWVITKLAPDLEPISVLSAFRWFQAGEVVKTGTLPVDAMLVFGITAAASWLAAEWAFRRRDLTT